MLSNKKQIYIAVFFLVVAAATVFLVTTRTPTSKTLTPRTAAAPSEQATKPAPHQFVGSTACKSCHESEYSQWMGSHHQQAMLEASDKSVLGNFDNSLFHHGSTTSCFYKKDSRFFVETDSSDGKLREYEIRYTFGFTPLQQYLIELDTGTYQALGIVWDSRPKASGGQRWYHLYEKDYPDDIIDFEHPLHWTNPSQNWNYVCADCHSTNLKRNFSRQQQRYHTTYAEINVSCESCHGPGAKHVEWANSEHKSNSNTGLQVSFHERRGINWIMDSVTGSAKRSQPNHARMETEICGQCHSRRTPFLDGKSDSYKHKHKLLDHYRLQLLTEGYYHPDGQPNNETYVLGSFMQSKMFKEGVTCSDCHNPHTLKPRLPGNGVCLQCHAADKFDTPKHHFHKPQSAGAQCMDCHASAQTYMGVDKRHDHSFRIPRPDLTISTGSPNACNTCHKDKQAQWAADKIKQWYGNSAKTGHQIYANVLHKVRQGYPDMGAQLRALIMNPDVPDIARATAIVELVRYPSEESTQLLQQLHTNSSDLIRMAVASSAGMLSSSQGVEIILTLAADPVKAVRMEVVRLALALPETGLTPAQRLTLGQLNHEYIEAQQTNSDRAEPLTNLGTLAMQRRQPIEAEQWLQEAIKRNPFFTGSYMSLASLYSSTARQEKAEMILTKGIQQQPSSADLHYSLGLHKIRQKQYPQALISLRNAITLAPHISQYQYTYAMATADIVSPERAIDVIQKALQKQPNNEQLLNGLMELYHQSGNHQKTLETLKQLIQLAPDNRQYQNIRQQLEK